MKLFFKRQNKLYVWVSYTTKLEETMRVCIDVERFFSEIKFIEESMQFLNSNERTNSKVKLLQKRYQQGMGRENKRS